MTPAEDISDRIRQAITDSGLLLRAIARTAEIDHGSLSRFMSGDRSIMLETVDKLSEVLDIQIERTPHKRR